jgi:hypothetical protein
MTPGNALSAISPRELSRLMRVSRRATSAAILEHIADRESHDRAIVGRVAGRHSGPRPNHCRLNCGSRTPAAPPETTRLAEARPLTDAVFVRPLFGTYRHCGGALQHAGAISARRCLRGRAFHQRRRGRAAQVAGLFRGPGSRRRVLSRTRSLSGRSSARTGIVAGPASRAVSHPTRPRQGGAGPAIGSGVS